MVVNGYLKSIGLGFNMNNEPVAWTDGKGNYFDKNSFFPVDDLIPLYTHPAKTLTDEEIVQECAKIADVERPSSLGCGYITKTKGMLIRERFGVKEKTKNE